MNYVFKKYCDLLKLVLADLMRRFTKIPNQTKFKYGENVIVNAGFYENAKGSICEYEKFLWLDCYKVTLTDPDWENFWASGEDMTSTDFPNKEFDDKLKKELETKL